MSPPVITASLPRITTKFIPHNTTDPAPNTAPLPTLPSPHPPTPVPSQHAGAPNGPAVSNGVNDQSGMRDDTSPISPSHSLRSPSHRPLSPDLPNRDVLYLFFNFSSYMRSPHEGSEGLAAEDFRHTIRLLDHARLLAAQPNSNVHILHLKYRFQGQQNTFRSPYSSGDYQLPLNYRDSVGRVRNPVPQPFSVLHDPVVKIDYMENGVFEPLPAQAVFSHIAKMCQPPPRIIVMSYVYSKVIENHLASLSTWALTSSPPAYVFSPLETRLRERRPLHLALHHAIPMSMFAWPAEGIGSPMSVHPRSPGFPLPISPPAAGGGFASSGPVERGQGAGGNSPGGANTPRSRRKDREHVRRALANSPILLTRRVSGQDSPTTDVGGVNPRQPAATGRAGGKSYPPDPVASLTIITSSLEDGEDSAGEGGEVGGGMREAEVAPPGHKRRGTSTSLSSGPPPVDRIPLWHLAPGVGILHGSTSASIGVRLGDFSAINLVGESGGVESGEAQKKVREREVEGMGVKTEVMGVDEIKATDGLGSGGGEGGVAGALLEHHISRPSSTTPLAVGIPHPAPEVSPKLPPQAPSAYPMTYLTPPDNPPPGPGPKNPSRPTHRSLNSQSWRPVSRVPGWRKGRKEMMEDTLEEMGMGYEEGGFEVGEVLRRVEELALGEAEAESSGEGARADGVVVQDGDELLDLLAQ
ncbi:hypothetical protein IAT38_001348 [Cryptococcus sp. DSM 104549]